MPRTEPDPNFYSSPFVFAIDADGVQEFAEEHYGKRLTEEELCEVHGGFYFNDDASELRDLLIASAIEFILDSEK